ncbi:hypothetical protein ACT3TS_02645 [Specibacter sp. AOP5-B1-6]|uniref:hypothetical protein n=1 Tax=Specibacter sp. AOP5-B1-6 TaxID=3457653 RepID=UPI00402BEB20
MKLMSIALTSMGAAAALVAATVVPANASSATDAANESQGAPASALSCQAGYVFDTTQKDVYLPNPGKRVYATNGGTLSFTSADASTVSGSLSVTASADAGLIFTKVGLSVGVTVSHTATATTTVGYSWEVSAGQDGWIEMGAHGYQINYTKSHYNSPCTEVIDQTDTIVGATENAWFTHS